MNSSRRDWLRRILTESEKVAIEPEVGQPEVVMVRVRNVAQDRNRVLRLGKCGDRLPTTETGSSATGTGSSATDDVSSVILGKLASNPYIYATNVSSANLVRELVNSTTAQIVSPLLVDAYRLRIVYRLTETDSL